ncbi:outer membrane efflux protein [Acidithiobacillus ferrivorans SS3]|uniref:Outer membrane efflux protein n=1 Tax=Acidithiobacillus ferrivorans SS3 TaxID=743299 RepID=G0JMP3_9PROT|nr:TolC family protein [Acidithiobacillus ferrivorans]AEM47072.1 outer membrane efflux protein [Acidithiobacillus ferrivorans SS3]
MSDVQRSSGNKHFLTWVAAIRRGSGPLSLPVMLMMVFSPYASASAAPLSLQNAEAIALRQNPGLGALTQKIAELRHKAVAVAQLPDPHLDLGALNLPLNSFSMNQQQMSMLSVGLSQTFPSFGKLGLEGQQAGEEAQATVDTLRGQSAELVLLLRRAWLQALYTENAMATVRHQEQLEAESVQAALALYRSAQGSQAEVLRAQLARDNLANDISKLQAEQASDLAQIAQILNLPEPPSIEKQWPNLPPAPTLAEAEARLSGQPLLRAAQAQTRAAQMGVQVAKTGYWPDVTVSVGYGQDFYPGSPNWLSAGVNLSLPIFPGDRQDQDVAVAQARAQQAQYRYDDQHLALTQQARAAFARYESYKIQLQRMDRQLLPTARNAFSATLAAYSAGRAGLNAVLRTQKEVLDYALNRLQYRRDLAISAAELDFLTAQGEMQP